MELTKKIQMVDLAGQYKKIEKEITEGIKKVIETTSFINGPAVKELKVGLQNELEVKHAIPCGNGTDALQIALMALDLEPGDEVITSTFTFIATAEVIALLGLKPVFVDVDPNNFNISVEGIKKAITPKSKVIIPVHLYGQVCDMDAICSIAQENGLKIIEDTAQAIGAVYTSSTGEKKYAGTIGDIGTTSFFPSKNLGCYGDGGAIFTNDDGLAEKMAMIVNHGSKVKYYHEIVGVNSRLDSIQAVVLNAKLKHLKTYCKARYTAASYYNNAFADIDWIETPAEESYSTQVYHQYTLRITNGRRDELRDFLLEKGIPSMIYYPVPLHKQKAFLKYEQKADFSVTTILEETVLSLPIHTELDEEILDYICNAIKSFK